MKSWKAEVIADSTGKWIPNGCAFATPKEARDYVWNLSLHWTAVKDTRVVASDEPVNYQIVDGKMRHVEAVEEPPYGAMCRNPEACKGKGYCPLDPTCGD
jgi:hypothetical protein